MTGAQHHERKVWTAGGLQVAIVERYPDGVVPWGISRAMGAEFGVSRSTVSHVIRELGYSVARPMWLRQALIERFPSGVISDQARRTLHEEFAVSPQRVRQVMRDLGLAASSADTPEGSPVRAAIASRYPAGIVPRGVSSAVAKEFGVSPTRVSKAISELGFRVDVQAPGPDAATVRDALAARYQDGVVPPGASSALVKEFRSTHAQVRKAIDELGFRVTGSVKEAPGPEGEFRPGAWVGPLARL